MSTKPFSSFRASDYLTENLNQKSLIIAEKASVARDISAALGLTSKTRYGAVDVWEGSRYLCTYAQGHLLTLKDPEDYRSHWKVWREQDLPMIPSSFGWKPKNGSGEHLRSLKDLIFRSDVGGIINACDAGREGELIFRLIYRYSGAVKPVKRVWLQSLMPEAIQNQFISEKLIESALFDGLASAGKTRSYIDWLFGMNLSRLATLKLSRPTSPEPWSVGRVQSPVLAAIVSREKIRRSFVSESFHTILAENSSQQQDSQLKWFVCDKAHVDFVPVKPFAFQCDDECQTNIKILANTVFSPEGFTHQTRMITVHAPQLFDLSALQQHMASKFDWTAKQTLTIAQQCYEQTKVLSYPRTDSHHLPPDYAQNLNDILTRISDSECFDDQLKSKAKALLTTSSWRENPRVFCQQSVTDHFAIIPTSIPKMAMTDLQNILYMQVVSRTLEALATDQVFTEIQYRYELSDKLIVLSNIVRVPVQDVSIPDPSDPTSTKLSIKNLPTHWSSKSHKTSPPPNYSESDLIQIMANGWPDQSEKIKLGTAATRADIIESLKERNYVTRDLRPTPKAFILIDQLEKWSGKLMTDPTLTSKMEYALDKVENLSLTSHAMLERANVVLTSIVTNGLKQSTTITEPCPGQSCPKCLKNQVSATPWVFLCSDPSCNWSLRRVQGDDYIDVSSLSKWRQTTDHPLVDRPQSPGSNVLRHTIWGQCPIHKGQDCLILETKKAFMCETRLKEFRSIQGSPNDSRGIMLPKSILGRSFKASEIKAFIADGITAPLHGFQSKDGLAFTASVRRLKSGGWEFVNRRWDLNKNASDPKIFQQNV